MLDVITRPGPAGHVEATDELLRAVRHRDARFDGWFVSGVLSTHIYCRPSCPALPVRADRLRFFPTAAAAQQHGFRACKRCRPDVTPGSPAWSTRSDVVARAMRLVADGVVDREGVAGLASRLGYSERQLHRLLTAEVGAGPLTLARSQRAATARTLLETTDLPLAQVAFAAGFGSIRQFNDTVRAVFDATPSGLRARRRTTPSSPGVLQVRLAARAPFDAATLLGFLGARAAAGLEASGEGTYTRSLSLPGGPALATLRAGEADQAAVHLTLWLTDLADVTAAVHRCRRLLDLDADPVAVGEVLGADPVLAPLVGQRPGLRSPGAVDGAEQAVRAVLGQQVSVAAARTLTSRLVAELGTPLPDELRRPEFPDVTHTFPGPEALAGSSLEGLAVTGARRRALRGLAEALADGTLRLDVGVDRRQARDELLALAGIGPWTAAYVSMRALGDPDVMLATDLGVRRAVERLGGSSPRDVEAMSERWRPWRSYALHHLWASLS